MDKIKRAPSSWAKAVAAHIKAGGKFPKKGSDDYDKVKKIMETMKADAPATEPAAKKEAPAKEEAEVKAEPVKKAPKKVPAVKKTITPIVESSESESDVEKVEAPVKKARQPRKPKAVTEVLMPPAAPAVTETPKKARAPRKPKAEVTEVAAEMPAPAAAQHGLRISQTIPLSCLRNMNGSSQFGF